MGVKQLIHRGDEKQMERTQAIDTVEGQPKQATVFGHWPAGKKTFRWLCGADQKAGSAKPHWHQPAHDGGKEWGWKQEQHICLEREEGSKCPQDSYSLGQGFGCCPFLAVLPYVLSNGWADCAVLETVRENCALSEQKQSVVLNAKEK